MAKTIIKLLRGIKGERGTALVTTIGAIAVISAFGVTVTMGVSSITGQSNRDRSFKRAMAAAEAGVQEASYRMNMLQPTSAYPCVTFSGGQFVLSAAPGQGQWCNAESIDLGNGATTSYQISPYSISSGVVTRNIVTTSTVNGVSRRVMVTTSANTGAPLFEAYAISSDQTMTLSGNANITGAARSNNDINMSGNASICGASAAATPGPGHSVNLTGNANVCGPTTPAETPFVLNPVDQGDAPQNNDNGRFFGQDPKTGTVSWNASTRQLSLSGNSTLTLGGHTYSFCKLSMSGNSQLIIAANAVVRLFIDSTTNCGLANNTNQFSMSGNAKLINTSQDPTHLQIYLMGGTAQTPNAATLSGNAVATELTFYAPNTNLAMSGNSATYKGALLSRQLTISGNGAAVSYDSRVTDITQATVGVYRRQKFVECTSSGGATPDSGC